MKWLFAVLVALNMMVLGGVVTHHMMDKKEVVALVHAPLEGGIHELALPESLKNQQTPTVENTPDWVSLPTNTNILEPESEEAKLARANKAKADKLKKEKKERAKREREEKLALQDNQQEGDVSNQCNSSASISMDEDDYHRIKGLLTAWPHAATRSVEKRNPKNKNSNKVTKTFRVLLPTNGDAISQLEIVNNKGFAGVIYDGEISIGVMSSRSAAQIMIARLSSSGLSGAHILEQQGREQRSSDGLLSVAKMNIVFLSVDERIVQDIRNVVGRYGNLSIKKC